MMKLSNLLIPLIVLIVIIYSVRKKQDIYDHFISGSKEGLIMSLNIFPTLLIMIISINIFLKSGLLELVIDVLEPIFNTIHFPKEIFPLAILRPLSGSSSLVMLNNIFTSYGPDTFIGRVSSIIVASTETTFYVLMLYFGSVGIKKIKYSLIVGLLTDLVTIILSLVIVKIMF